MPRKKLTLHFDALAYAGILLEAVAAFPMETGGLLLGTWDARDIATVAEVIGPGPDAEHAATSFEPDADWQRAALADAWRRHPGSIVTSATGTRIRTEPRSSAPSIEKR